MRGLLLMAPAFVVFLLLIGPLASEYLKVGEVAYQFEWVPQLDLSFALRLHGVGLLLALLVTGIGSFIMLYASGYMDGYPGANKLYGYLYAFMLAMLGLALSDHLLLTFIFWELTSITSYLLIGFNHEKSESRRNALQALLVTGLGGMALMAGFILLAQVYDTWILSEILSSSIQVTEHAWYPAILILVALGAFTKSAQFPFHFWLPNAMAAPTPVSAYLHSATMVKAGVYLLALMLPILGGTQMWTLMLCIAGGITLILGGWFGLQQNDLKKLLAGTTLAVLGLLTFLLGLGTEKAALAAILFLLGHALYKATLFMVAGSIDHEAGTRDIRILGSLRGLMPVTCAAALIAAVSKMGLPPLFGFIGKEYTYKATLAGGAAFWMSALLIVGNAILFALAFKAGVLPFWKKGDVSELPKKPHEAPLSMYAGPVVLSLLGLVFGLFPALVKPLVQACMTLMAPAADPISIKLWAGFNLPLLLSGVTVALGAVIVVLGKRIQLFAEKVKMRTFDEYYDVFLKGVVGLANWQTRTLQSGNLRHYLIIILCGSFALVAYKLSNSGQFGLGDQVQSFSWPAVFIILTMFPAILFAITTQNRITALIALGVIGFGIALIFAIYSAPDLAITQILVETLTVALFAWVVSKLPKLRMISDKSKLFWDALISISAGALVTIMVLKSKAVDLGTRISDQLTAWSYPEAHGSNVVNVILVDFRALDTLGEVVVLFIAAVGVWALLSNSKKITEKEVSQ
ncbi:MAG: hydrogen gas-evolving membrane-bound hydrogenase subunit E [Opitutales bacterium]